MKFLKNQRSWWRERKRVEIVDPPRGADAMVNPATLMSATSGSCHVTVSRLLDSVVEVKLSDSVLALGS